MARHQTAEDVLQRLLMTVNVRKADQRREYILGHLLLLSVAVAAAVGGPLFVIFPDALSHGALGDALPLGLERGWAVTYGIGGSLVLGGMHQLDARYEVAGLMGLACCFALYSYAIITVNGLVPGVIVASILFTLAVGCVARAYILRFEPGGGPWQRRS